MGINMHRFFLSSDCISKSEAVISGSKERHYFCDVLRFKSGEEVIIFDEKGNEYSCLVDTLSPLVCLKIKRKLEKGASAKKTTLAIGCAIPKGSAMDDIVDKLTQLGVERIIPLNTERVIVKLDRNKEQLRLKRWQKIAVSASQQSQRSSVPVIETVKGFCDFIPECASYDLKIIPNLAEDGKPLKEIMAKGPYRSIIALIGPEGDFTDAEVARARGAGFVPVTLGELVLRVETAAVTVAGFINLYENS
jgi:16S rRNA (uracil1498-N3)-methyltransferase